jgi:hypothetical protein
MTAPNTVDTTPSTLFQSVVNVVVIVPEFCTIAVTIDCIIVPISVIKALSTGIADCTIDQFFERPTLFTAGFKFLEITRNGNIYFCN